MAPAQPLQATLAEFHADRPAGADEDVHMCTAIVDHVINAYSAPGDLVFDPFAGFGTTLSRAVALGRRAAGVELLPGRVAQIHATTPEAHVVEGDARRFLPQLASSQPPPAVNLILTSPPYMAETETDTDPLEAYEQGSGDYQRYLAELNDVARACSRLVRPGGHMVWNVGDIQHGGVYTPLIDDCAALLAQHLERITVTDIQWDEYPHDITRDALLVFRRDQNYEPQ
ncbi:DNA methyltransferase [Corynebacterium meitnerae]|uniref:Site-specific DNA-methyltransferase n=1 Tax=Corynebacterium meitnerae TaxID=2913498 RepID=A0A9X3LVB7_9CORY|nr:DNA methyltransferase [Corynebacterium meitnerae]MCZ9293845.1 site-specific DNA-methyltransferase [Corynebacterium meitnerae]